MLVTGRLKGVVQVPGSVVKPGYHTGEMDAAGIVWLDLFPTSPVPGKRTARRIGVHVSKFEYIETAADAKAAGGDADPRAAVKAAIKAAEAKQAARGVKA